MDATRPLKLICPVQNYAWGKIGGDSLIAQLRGEQHSSQPFAELWVGAHPSAPAKFEVDGKLVTLDRAITEAPEEMLGSSVVSRFGSALPFMFKVLSIRTALSIQAHPDKSLAIELHRRSPEHYPDDNHKPEIAIAVTDVELLYGFRPLSEIRQHLQRLPELLLLLPDDTRDRMLNEPLLSNDHELLRDVYASIMHGSSEKIAQVTALLATRLTGAEDRRPEDEWVLRLLNDYPAGDAGLFSFYLLNFGRLKPGEAVFVGPGVPHAYLYGDLVECMASSDNVVRAGLTPKFKDVETLLKMLHFQSAVFEILHPRSRGAAPERYPAPVKEFYVECLESDEPRGFQSSGDSVELVFCLEGKGDLRVSGQSYPFSSGESFLIPAAAGSVEVNLESGKLFRIGVP